MKTKVNTQRALRTVLDDDDKGISRKNQGVGRASGTGQKNRKEVSSHSLLRLQGLSLYCFSLECLIPSVLCRTGHKIENEAEVSSAPKRGDSVFVFTFQIFGREKHGSPPESGNLQGSHHYWYMWVLMWSQ